MKQKFILVASVFSLLAVAMIARQVVAVTNNADTVESDYARDVKLGQDQLKSDPEAATAQQQVEQSEKVEAQVDSQVVKPEEEVHTDEAIEPVADLLPEDNQVIITPEPQPTEEVPSPEISQPEEASPTEITP